MKSLRTLFVLLATVLLVADCINEPWGEQPMPEPAEGQVRLPISIRIPEPLSTKALGETPSNENLHLYVAVFDGSSDALLEIKEAETGTPVSSSGKTVYPFQVEISSSTHGTLRIIQLVAAATSLDDRFTALNIGDNETTFAEKLRVSDGVDAYWGRLELDHIQNDTETINALTEISMIRNFAKVTVRNADTEHFELVGFKVFNHAKSGMAVPVNVNKKPHYVNLRNPNKPEGTEVKDAKGNDIKIPVKWNTTGNTPVLDADGCYVYDYDHFANYASLPTTGGAYTNMTGTQKYLGYIPASVEWVRYSDEYNMTDAGGSEVVYSRFSLSADYIYESTYYGNEDFPFIILAGRYRENSSAAWGDVTFYKADFVNESNEYYHILRNFQYDLSITNVKGNGCINIYEAVQSIAMNNFEGSTQAQALTNIADGKYQMYISRTSVLNTYGTEVVLYLKNMEENNGVYETNRNDLIHQGTLADPVGGTVITNVTIAGSDETTGEWAGWRKATITVYDPDKLNAGDVRTQKVSFTNAYSGYEGFTRTCEIRIREPLPARVKCEAYVPAVKNSGMYIDIIIPAGIRQDVFPLTFYISVDGNTLYPDASGETNPLLPVIVDSVNDTYFFERTIDWDEYYNTTTDSDGMETFRSYFKTAVDASATTVHLSWDMDKNPYFTGTYDGVTVNVDDFVNDRKAGRITFEYEYMQLQLNGAQGANSKTYTATSNSGAPISYYSADESIAYVDRTTGQVTAVGVGTTYIYATCPAKDEYTAVTGDAARYTVNVTQLDLIDLDLHWTGNPSTYVQAGEIVSTQATASASHGDVFITYHADPIEGDVVVTMPYSSYPAYVAYVNSGTGIFRVTATATVTGVTGYADTQQTIWYDVHVFSGTPQNGSVYHEESFLDSERGLGLYSITDVSGNAITPNVNLDHENVWFLYTKANDPSIVYGAAASGYKSSPATCYVTNACLVSKPIDVYSANNVMVTFQHAGNYFTSGDSNLMSNYCKVEYRFCSDMDDTAAGFQATAWYEGTIDNYPPGYNWKYYEAHVPIDFSKDDPSQYGESIQQKILQIRFHYTSDTSIAGTWEIKNVKVVEQ